MDGAREVERKRAAYAVSANVHTRAWQRVSFGEPVDNPSGCGPSESRGTFVGRVGCELGSRICGTAVKE